MLWPLRIAMTTNRSHPHDLTDRLLAGVSPDARQDILAVSRRRTLRAAQTLCRAGEPAEHLFLLRKGRVQFSRLARTGREIVMGILVPGDVFGLGTILAQRVDYLGTAKSLEPGEVLVWTRETLQALTDEHPLLSANALHVALRYVAVFEQRLSRALTRLGVRTGIRTRAGIEVRITNEQLASLADVSPFTASRLLKRWERDRVITKSRGMVHIVNPEKLLLY